MATVSARRQAKSIGSRPVRQESREPSGRESQEVPVLIRLPDLTEPVAEKTVDEQPELLPDRKQFPVTTGSRAQPDAAQPTSASPRDQSGITDAADQQSPPSERREEPAEPATPQAEPTGSERSRWPTVPVLRTGVQVAIAIALIGIFITGYLIVVGRGGNETATDTGSSTGQDATAVSSAAGDFPLERGEPADIAIVPPLAAGQPDRPLQTAEAKTRQDGTSLTAPASSSEPVASRERIGDTDPQAEEAAVSEDAVEWDVGQTPDPSSHDQAEALAQQNDPAPDATADTPRRDVEGLEVSPVGQQSHASSYPYPVTDPATFQYPADYHTKLQAMPGFSNSRDATSRSDRGGAYEQYEGYPSAARLQPRIDPPSFR